MRIEEPPPIRKPLPLTPLVDVVFLLLMFFMLSSNFTQFAALFLDGAARGGETAPSQPVAGVIIRVAPGPQISLNGQPVPLASLAGRLDAFATMEVQVAVLEATQGARVQDLITVLEMARSSRLRRVIVK